MSNVVLLDTVQTRRKLGNLTRMTFYRLEPKLIARGVKMIKIGTQKKYLESSIDDLILRLVENEENL